MLHKYSFANFQSFRDRTEVDFTLNRKITMTDWMTEAPTGDRISKIMAVIGANGSGKTALLKPLAFMSWFITSSFQEPPENKIPVTPHAGSQNEPAEMECTIDMDGKLWRYVLRCTPDRVLHEALYQKRERFGYVFIRDWDANTKSYLVKQQDFGLAPQEAIRVRPNVSLISWAAQYGVPLAMQIKTHYVITNVNVLGRVHMSNQDINFAAQHFFSHPRQRSRMEKLLSSWDLGLSNVVIREVYQESNQKVLMPFGKHKCKTGDFELPFFYESSGTQGAFVLLFRLLHTLEIGGMAVIDEFENDLHPHMLLPILDLFSDPKSNPHSAQLLFTCHATEVLNLVHKSQVILVQKNEDCESSACRLDDIQGVRSVDNYYAKYMSGAYGAVPVFN